MNRKIVIGIVVAAIFVASMFAGCVEEENEPTATPTPTITSAPTPILVNVEQIRDFADPIAENILVAFNEDNYAKWSEHFDAPMKNELSEPRFNELNADIQLNWGAYVSKEYWKVESQNQYTIVYYKATFTQEPDDVIVKVVFQEIGGETKVSGLWITPAPPKVTLTPTPTPTPTPAQTPTPVATIEPEILSHTSYVDDLEYFNVVGEVKNNLPSNVNYVKITATFYDAQKNVIGTDYTYTELDLLTQNQKSPFELSSYPDEIDPSSYKLKVSYRETGDEPITGLKILSYTAKIDELGYHEIVGEVENAGTKGSTYVKVICTYYDAKGEVIGTDFTYTDPDEIDAGDSAPFELSSYPRELRPAKYVLQVTGR